MNKTVGIDNGLSGGIVLLEDQRITRKMVMPVVKTGKGSRKDYDEQSIINFLLEVQPDLAVLEKSQAYPKQGGVSNWSTGMGAGLIRGIVAALKIPRMVVHPRTWQAKMFMGMTHDDTKAAAFNVCRMLWPDEEWKTERMKKQFHDGLCDAAMLAEYGRREYFGGQR